MRIATWNVNSLKVRISQVIEWMEASKCDILAVQETKLENHNFPIKELLNQGFYSSFNGEKQFNGVAIISRYPIKNVINDIPNFEDPQKRVISAIVNDIKIIAIYVVNGESIESSKYIYKMNWLNALINYLDKTIDNNHKLIVLGDFNIAPQDEDIYDPILFKNQVLCSNLERLALQKILNLGLFDSFRLFNKDDKQFTWWDYRNFSFKKNNGARIDHIFINEAVRKITTNVFIDKEPRKNERPSDHTPIIIDLI